MRARQSETAMKLEKNGGRKKTRFQKMQERDGWERQRVQRTKTGEGKEEG